MIYKVDDEVYVNRKPYTKYIIYLMVGKFIYIQQKNNSNIRSIVHASQLVPAKLADSKLWKLLDD